MSQCLDLPGWSLTGGAVRPTTGNNRPGSPPKQDDVDDENGTLRVLPGWHKQFVEGAGGGGERESWS